MIYIIQKIWVDPFENKEYNAIGYTIIGYVTTKEEAEEWGERGRDYDVNDCWAIKGTVPEYKYITIQRL